MLRVVQQKTKADLHMERVEYLLSQILTRVGRLESLLRAEAQGVRMDLDDLLKKVTEETAVEQSVIALLGGLSTQLKDALAANDPAKVQAVSDALDANIATMAAAVTANTPAA